MRARPTHPAIRLRLSAATEKSETFQTSVNEDEHNVWTGFFEKQKQTRMNSKQRPSWGVHGMLCRDMRCDATRRSLLTRSKEPSRFLFSSNVDSEYVMMCRRRAYCAVMQHCRWPWRNRQDAVNNEKEFLGKTEGGKGVDREREGRAKTHPECHHLVCFVWLILGVLRWKRSWEHSPQKSRCWSVEY